MGYNGTNMIRYGYVVAAAGLTQYKRIIHPNKGAIAP